MAHHDNGKHMFNFSEWMGAATAVAVSDGLHPGNEHGFGPGAKWASFTVVTDMGLDVLREFWPEIARKLKMPFREKQKPQTAPQSPAF